MELFVAVGDGLFTSDAEPDAAGVDVGLELGVPVGDAELEPVGVGLPEGLLLGVPVGEAHGEPVGLGDAEPGDGETGGAAPPAESA